MEIPVPTSGYWTRIRFGKEVKKQKLPDDYHGEKEVSIDSKEPLIENWVFIYIDS